MSYVHMLVINLQFKSLVHIVSEGNIALVFLWYLIPSLYFVLSYTLRVSVLIDYSGNSNEMLKHSYKFPLRVEANKRGTFNK